MILDVKGAYSMNKTTIVSPRVQYFILIGTIIAAGLSQGLLLPLLTVILEEMGVPSHLNGLNAGMLYVGTFVMMLFVEPLLELICSASPVLSGQTSADLASSIFPRTWFYISPENKIRAVPRRQEETVGPFLLLNLRWTPLGTSRAQKSAL